VSSEYICSFAKNETYIYVNELVLEVFTAARQTDPTDSERFGVLIGSKSLGEEHYWIEQVTQPLAQDKATRTSFTMQDPGHQRTIDAYFKKSKGKSIYLGTWHTHPQRIPSPSSIDRKDWHCCIERNQDRQLFFLIIGTGASKAYLRIKRNILSMRTIDG